MFLCVDDRGRIAAFEDRPRGAAHSMDTDWYAVDRGGRVARFWSGEEGVVPYDAHQQYWEELCVDLLAARIASPAPGDPLDERAALERHRAAARDPTEVALLTAILGGDEPARAIYADWLEEHGRAREGWTPRERTAFAIGETSRPFEPSTADGPRTTILRFTDREALEAFRALHDGISPRELDARLGLRHALAVDYLPAWELAYEWTSGRLSSAYVLEPSLAPHHLGLFEYECAFSGPYARRAVPRAPLDIAALPEPLRTTLAALPLLRIDFAAAGSLAPDAHARCREW